MGPTEPFFIDQQIKVYATVKYRAYFIFSGFRFLKKVLNTKNERKPVPSATCQIKVTRLILRFPQVTFFVHCIHRKLKQTCLVGKSVLISE